MSVAHSESLNELATALAAAQAELPNIPKDESNPYFKSKYASLPGVLELVRPILARHGLSVVQLPAGEGRAVSVATMLLHKSGQWLRESLTVEAKDGSPQAVGSAITYCRRYALMAVLGVAPEDDDGEAAQPVRQEKARSNLNPTQVQNLTDLLARKGKSASGLCKKFNVAHLRLLTIEQFQESVEKLTAMPDAQPAPA